jgi:PTH1 family peptidyl-tRNA hydrolase
VENDVTSLGSATPTERAVVVGLGNPGAGYQVTRHNLGFQVVDRLHRRRAAEAWREECAALVSVGTSMDLVKPQTFMNRSGHAVRCLVDRHGYQPGNILVVYDDIDLPLGTLRLRPGGSPGGHRGLASVIESLRTDRVPRLRLGIAPGAGASAGDLAEFVLQGFEPAERAVVERQVERAADACEAWLEQGVESAMNAFNGPLPAPADREAASARMPSEDDARR